ncbi:phage tail fiber protein [Pseudomonas sp. zfem003]|uniref:phage tail fiber domain-containing protein n=1 Tax=Pseudomonas sp. zfem003 TaxID=3078198 RepID=UPI002928E618|nr:phage tail fiber protein [Pseudomonas sp. zfem003]MDU9399310.1 phage tail fiber protein [Pseudomonas sp. zfem003]
MAVTTVYTYDLNGSKKDFDVPFEYLARRFVQVTLIGQDRKTLDLASDFRFVGKTSIQTLKAWGPADGYERIEIRRNTSATDRLVDFADGSILRANELNTSQVQTLHVAEEARNMVADTIAANQDGDLDARGRRLVNLADALAPDHAVTLRQETAWAASTLGNKQAAESARDAAREAQRAAEMVGQSVSDSLARALQAEATSVTESARAKVEADRSAAATATIGNNVQRAETARVGAEGARDQAANSAGFASQEANRAKAEADKASARLPATFGTLGTINAIFFPATVDPGGTPYLGALEIRETGKLTTTLGTSEWVRPSLSMHWGGYTVRRLSMDQNGSLWWGSDRISKSTPSRADSGWTPWTAGGTVDFSHGLGELPSAITLYGQALVAVGNTPASTIFELSMYYGSYMYNAQVVYVDANIIRVRFGHSFQRFTGLNSSDGFSPANSNMRIVCSL